jgi:Holliday junction resolvase-like predicted endonuclease
MHHKCFPETEEGVILSVIKSNVFKNSYPYLHKHEWEVRPGRPQYGRGDLLFTDGKNSYLIVECKYINQYTGKTARSARRNRRKKVEQQARFYAEKFAQFTPRAILIGYVHITNEEKASMESAEDRILYLDIDSSVVHFS